MNDIIVAFFQIGGRCYAIDDKGQIWCYFNGRWKENGRMQLMPSPAPQHFPTLEEIQARAAEIDRNARR